MDIDDLNGDEIIGTFYQKELQKTNQQEFRIENVMTKKGNKLYVKLKGYDSSFNSWIDRKYLIKSNSNEQMKFCHIKMSQHFPKPYEPFGGDSNVRVDLSNYAKKQISKIFRMLILQVLL